MDVQKQSLYASGRRHVSAKLSFAGASELRTHDTRKNYDSFGVRYYRSVSTSSTLRERARSVESKKLLRAHRSKNLSHVIFKKVFTLLVSERCTLRT